MQYFQITRNINLILPFIDENKNEYYFDKGALIVGIPEKFIVYFKEFCTEQKVNFESVKSNKKEMEIEYNWENEYDNFFYDYDYEFDHNLPSDNYDDIQES